MVGRGQLGSVSLSLDLLLKIFSDLPNKNILPIIQTYPVSVEDVYFLFHRTYLTYCSTQNEN